MAHGWTQADVDRITARRQMPRQPTQEPHQTTIAKTAAPSKHRNKKVVLDGLMFDSAKEAKRWQELSLWQQVGAIRDLRRQVRYELYAPNGERICAYVADFVYWSLETGKEVREDVKSDWTRRLPVYRIKCKWMAAQGTPITEV